VAIVPSGFVHQAQIDQGLQTAAAQLGSDVVRVRYELGEDWKGDEALFFRVVLKDSVSDHVRLREVARRVTETVFREIRPDRLGLEAYYNFRSESEQSVLKEEAWA
jgi:hypothetical protein